MDSENAGNASGERESSPSHRVYQRHTVEQIQRLESSFNQTTRASSAAEPEETPHQVVIRTLRGLDENTVLEKAASAMNELVELLSTTEPVWVTWSDGRCMLHPDTYEKIRPMPSSRSPLKPNGARVESSKDSAEVALSAAELAQLLYDPKQRMEMFPAIVSMAVPIHALDTQNFGGSVHLMYEKMHVLSPHVAAREFVLIRYCRQLSSNSWAIADVSLDLFRHVPEACPVQSWKFPSGCVIQETSHGKSKVTWVEHVHQVDDKSQNHRLYRDVVRSCQAYGAKRWIAALRTMCDRLASSNRPIPPLRHELERVVATVECRKNMMRLSKRMVRDFFNDALNMTEVDDFDFPNMCEPHMTGVRVSMRRNDAPGQPDGSIIAMATSLWLPFSVDFLFNFFNDDDDTRRAEWDVLTNGNPMKTIARISTGTHQGSSVAFMQPYVPNQNKLSILQETVVDSLGAALVYTPIDIMSIASIINGIEDDPKAEILPSGVVISGDGRVNNNYKKASSAGEAEAAASSGKALPDGSLVTIAFQVLGSRADKRKSRLSMDTFLEVHLLISSTVQNIRKALNLQD